MQNNNRITGIIRSANESITKINQLILAKKSIDGDYSIELDLLNSQEKILEKAYSTVDLMEELYYSR